MHKEYRNQDSDGLPSIGLDLGTFQVKGVLRTENEEYRHSCLTRGDPLKASKDCLQRLLEDRNDSAVYLGLTGANADLLAERVGVEPILEIEALQLGFQGLEMEADRILSLGHENMYYLELEEDGRVSFFNRNSQCAAGSGSFWYQQATRMGYDDRQLAELALEAENEVKISGRCAVFAKSDMTHAINEGATQASVSAGMARALTDMVLTGVAQNRINGGGELVAVGGVANNRAVMMYIQKHCQEHGIEVILPDHHQYINAYGAAIKGERIASSELEERELVTTSYQPQHPLPPLEPERVKYMDHFPQQAAGRPEIVYLGVDCGSVSTKCVLLDQEGDYIGGVYLPTAGRPALQVLELMKRVKKEYGQTIDGAPIVASTTGSGRFLSQKILEAEYAVDEITCQAEGVKYLCGDRGLLSIIEIGGEDSKFLQLKEGVLYDYNMNPVCAAGTGTFLENLAALLGVEIKEEFSQLAFEAEYAIDLGDICTLLSQSVLVSAAAQGLPLSAQLASLAYSSARNYISKTVENRPLEGRIVFTGATAKNHALASAFARECEAEITVPPHPELSGALGSAIIARSFHQRGEEARFNFKSLENLQSFEVNKRKCKADCEHEHNCTLDLIIFEDGSKFLYGDRCGRYSGMDRSTARLDFPDYLDLRNKHFYPSETKSQSGGPRVGIARYGLFFDLYPFWRAFFAELGAEVVLSSETSDRTLEEGKKRLEAEMCFPMEVLLGHYQELAERDDLDYIFVPEVVNMEPLPWAEEWPRGFTCSLLQLVWGVVVNSLKLDEEQVLYAQLNYRGGRELIASQLEDVASKILGVDYSHDALEKAVRAAYQAQEKFSALCQQDSQEIMKELKNDPQQVVAVFLGRSYTIYDHYVSKGSLDYARQRGLLSLPQDVFIDYLRGWYRGEDEALILDDEDEFKAGLRDLLHDLDNVYPIQLQKMITVVYLVNFLNRKREETGLPHLNIIIQDPFKCGPNAMLRHFLDNMTGFLRLTLDEHTAPAGMITRLEAFKNTCSSRDEHSPPELLSARTRYLSDRDYDRILIPEPTAHSRVFAGLFRGQGLEAEILPRSQDGDLSLAKRYVNGDECLPLIQNVQDYLSYLENNAGQLDLDRTVFFQGWACGPCRYGLYAPTQSLIINRAGFGEGRVCAVKLADILKRFNFKFVVSAFNGMLTVDLLYKMLHTTRPYEREPGASEELFNHYIHRLVRLLEEHQYSAFSLVAGRHLRPYEELLREAERDFSSLESSNQKRPRILVGGEFYVRLDDRCNEEIIKKIEQAGGEVSLAPASEVFTYTSHINHNEVRMALQNDKRLEHFLQYLGYGFINWLAIRDEKKLEAAAAGLLHDQHEPLPEEIKAYARSYVSEHYGGEPPMTIGRVCSFAQQEQVAGAVFVAPFTCMPGSVVEAQLGVLRQRLDLPMVALYYDGKENANRDEFINGLVFQARQRIGS